MRSLVTGFVLLAACSDTPSNYAGTYTLTVTNQGGATCDLPSWIDGQVNGNVDVTVTQDPSDKALASVIFGGVTGQYLDSILGTHVITGFVTGDGFSAQVSGSTALNGGACAQPTRIDANVTFVLASDGTAHGDISYGRVLDGTACNTACASDQVFDGTRK